MAKGLITIYADSISKVISQSFSSRCTAVCFTRNFMYDVFYCLFYLLDIKCGEKVKTCHSCMSAWTYHLFRELVSSVKCIGIL